MHMNRLPVGRRAQIIGLLAEGNSLRAASRLADVSINTVTKLLLDVGAACEEYQDKTLRNLKSQRIQCDEIWAFVYAKNKNLPEKHKGEFGYGDVWTWTAIDADTKLIPSWAVGRRDGFTASAFIRDLADRLSTRVQLTTDGHRVYLEAVEGAFGNAIDYAMLIKTYEGDSGKRATAERRYSPAVCTGIQMQTITGDPDPDHISTSFVERSNLTIP
jgi:IS1 family transposase